MDEHIGMWSIFCFAFVAARHVKNKLIFIQLPLFQQILVCQKIQ